jgi:hypothetical protein
MIYIVISSCTVNTCLNGATCQSLSDGIYICNCANGYSGINCQICMDTYYIFHVLKVY